MPLILPSNYPFTGKLAQKGAVQLEKTNKPSLKIGFLNLMPEAEKYEPGALELLGRSPHLIEPVFIRSEQHSYKSSDKNHLKQFYTTFNNALNTGISGIIITGAPVEKIDFKDVTYWNELYDIMQYSYDHLEGTMGLCWGGMAMGAFLGVGKVVFEKKIFGVFLSQNLNPDHPVTGGDEKVFFCPQSRYAGFNEEDISTKSREKAIEALAYSDKTGHFIIAAPGKNFVAHIGHPEYTVERILFEYHRDQRLGLNTIPENFDVNNPVFSWENSGRAFFVNWAGLAAGSI